MSDDKELKPCPFCGGNEIRRDTYTDYDSYVWCLNPDYPIYDVEINKTDWNTRAK